MTLTGSDAGQQEAGDLVPTSPKPPFPRTLYCLNVFFVTGCLLDRGRQQVHVEFIRSVIGKSKHISSPCEQNT